MKWTKEKEQYLKDHYQNTEGGILAEILQVKEKTLRTKLRRLGIKKIKKANAILLPPLSKIEEIKNNYLIYGTSYCIKVLKYNLKILNTIIRKFKLDQSENRRLNAEFSRNEKFKNAYFNIGTKETAYMMGLLWGDGYINSIKNKYFYPGITMVTEDFKEIQHIFENWEISNRQREKRKLVSQAYLCDGNLGCFLVKNDYKIKKEASPTKILNHIPENLKHYFWRGLIDADGCFYMNKPGYLYQFSLAGSYNQDWSEFQNLLHSLGINHALSKKISKKGHKSSIIRFTNKKDISIFCDYLYPNPMDTLGLQRKRDKANLIKSKLMVI